MKKLLSLITVLAILCGCALIPTAFADDVTQLEFWTWRPEDVEFYDSVIADFEASNPDIKITQTAIKNTEYNTVLSAALKGETAPDVFLSRSYGGLKTLTDSGYLLALDELVPNINDFSEPAKKGATSITDGKIYGVPVAGHTVFCYYNTKIYDELGLEVPTTWADFKANLQACKDAGYYGLANGTKDGWTVETLFGAVAPSFYGGEAFFDKVVAGETTFEDPVFVNALTKMTELAEFMPDMYEGVPYEDMQSNFINEMAGHFIAGTYEAGTFKSQNPELEYGIFAVPAESADVPAIVTVYADANFSIPVSTKHQDAAVRFVNYLASTDFGQKIVAERSMISSVPGIDVSNDPFIQNVLELQKNSTSYLFLVGFRYEQPTGSSLLQSVGQSMMVGKMTPAETCAEIQKGIATYYLPFQK